MFYSRVNEAVKRFLKKNQVSTKFFKRRRRVGQNRRASKALTDNVQPINAQL